MELGLFWLLAAIVVAIAANARGRSGIGWFLLAILISPLLAVILLVLIPALGIARQPVPVGAAVAGSREKTCPRCAESVKAAAQVCRYCGHEFGGSGSRMRAT